MNKIFKLVIAIVVSEFAGIIGSLFTMPAIAGWYANIAKPRLSPPNWVFGPVWTTLFLLMGIAAFLVWQRGLNRKDVRIALGIFIGQLVLNTLWSIIFFGLHSPGFAFLEIIFLWLAILATIIVFARISRPAALLLVPYILWVSFASYLNFMIWTLNSAPAGLIESNKEAIQSQILKIDNEYRQKISDIGEQQVKNNCIAYKNVEMTKTLTGEKTTERQR